MLKSNENFVTEHIFEIRYPITGKFLDIRGSLADYIQKKNIFQNWDIQSNYITFFNIEDENSRALVAYNKIIYAFSNIHNENFSQKKFIFFLETLKDFKEYPFPEKIDRLGIRTKCFATNKTTFHEIYENIRQKIFNNAALSQIGSNLTNLQLIFDTEEKDYNSRFILEPIKENEAKKYFSFNTEKFSQSGLYIDIDFFKIDGIYFKNLRDLTKQAVKLTWEKINTITSTIEIRL